ncbi:acylneuraminate cytidylyltransferase family protein [Helicobacter sp. 11S02629-2]|uniref:acylneuraminate cytidylyltransferase family protein n=1 Tax=Helicobacter sp. 11S02629-2 TaxID=1476195 RepID=UPI000BDDD4BA|nr:acylneuraminate cytidylyltransferase family protein [Helicobacter sp. 11S02629-2]PAF44671.1 hypothetical protein BKH40_05195 [Helicobacter sp. 11S02629-2]
MGYVVSKIALKSLKTLALIPARSGSKGLLHKNIKEFCGKPLLAYTIKAALDSKVCDYVLVSTDSLEYADIAIKYGAKVPFLRSEKNSSDFASASEVIAESLESLKELGLEFDTLVFLQPTSPLRDASDIRSAFKLFVESKEDVVAVCKARKHINLLRSIDEKGFLQSVSKTKAYRRQDYLALFEVNGALYINNLKNFTKDTRLNDNKKPFLMPSLKGIDIDDEDDFFLASCVMRHLSSLKGR